MATGNFSPHWPSACCWVLSQRRAESTERSMEARPPASARRRARSSAEQRSRIPPGNRIRPLPGPVPIDPRPRPISSPTPKLLLGSFTVGIEIGDATAAVEIVLVGLDDGGAGLWRTLSAKVSGFGAATSFSISAPTTMTSVGVTKVDTLHQASPARAKAMVTPAIAREIALLRCSWWWTIASTDALRMSS